MIPAERRLQAAVTVLHEELGVQENLPMFLNQCYQHLTRIGMMSFVKDGTVEPDGDEVVVVLERYARETYAVK